ncbi:MAG: N-acetyltransferase [Spirochaetales bacterium]|nr:N-acetyltransferase [Spirochaetales bacterium]
MEIRKATRDDVPAWFELVYAVKSENLTTLFGMTTPLTPQSSAQYLEKLLSVEGSFLLVCFEGSRAIGSLDCVRYERPEQRHVATLAMCVTRDWRGRGIGRQLLQTCIELCKTEGFIEKLELEVFSNNPGAISLYRSLGFEMEGVRTGSIRKAGKPLDLICMGKWLS